MILAVDTATRAMSVALLEGDELRAELTTWDPRVHSERLLPAVDAVLRSAGVDLEGVDAFAVSIGPGSFTGLRIGLATLKGLAFGSERPVAAVPTLMALAAAVPEEGAPVLALLDAQRGEVYAALHPTPAVACVARADELPALAPADGALRIVAGEGAEPAAARLADALGGRAVLVPPVPHASSAARVARVGQRLLDLGRGVPAEALVPHYVRRAEAEVRRTGLRLEAPGSRANSAAKE